MTNGKNEIPAAEYEEEVIPFDDVMRTLLKAKPQHREAVKPKAKKPGKTKKKD